MSATKGSASAQPRKSSLASSAGGSASFSWGGSSVASGGGGLGSGGAIGAVARATSLSKDTGSPPKKGLKKEEFLVINFLGDDAVIMLPFFLAIVSGSGKKAGAILFFNFLSLRSRTLSPI